jgi:hypothetical protein
MEVLQRIEATPPETTTLQLRFQPRVSHRRKYLLTVEELLLIG